MRCGRTFPLARTHPARARSSGTETLSRSQSLVGYTIDTHESEVFGSHSLNRGSALHHAGPRWKCGGVFGVERRHAREVTLVEEIYPFRVHRLNLGLLGERR